MAQDVDYLIVGAGSAGCVLARRLSEDRSVRVLLLDAGPDVGDVPPEIAANLERPERFQMMQDSSVDWAYWTEPEAALGGRSVFVPRGRIVGGSSTFMAGIFARGNPADYDEWEELGNPGWRFDEVLRHFIRVERNLGCCFTPGYHGTDGPMTVTDLARTEPGEIFARVAAERGYPHNEDFNDAHQEGAGFYQFYLDESGRRVNSAWSYLTPDVRRRPNLTIAPLAFAQQVLIEQGDGAAPRAVGVRWEDRRGGGRKVEEARARREVIVACGTIDSPKLLMLSGIGPADELAPFGISVVADLPGVGKNLQEHIICPVAHLYKEGAGPGKVIGYSIEGGLFVRTRRGQRTPVLQYVFNHGLLGPPGQPVVPFGFMMVPILVDPASRGEVRLRDAYFNAPPRIFGRYLTGGDDFDTLVEGVALAVDFVNDAAFEPIRGPRLLLTPEKARPSRQEIGDYVRAASGTLYHPVGTCQMGPDPHRRGDAAVVDHQLRVHGVERLRVVDASVMPRVPTGNTHTPAAMIGEKASEMIRSGA